MGNRENRFRILAVVLSVLFFCAGIVLTLGIFLPITGFAPANYTLFAIGQRIFSVYGFSSFLIPLLFLYGAVLLLIPGWSRESKAVLLGVPLYFVTAIIGERLIYIFVPSVSIPLIKQFVTVSILICALLLVCFEIFLMLTLSEKFAGRRFSLRTISEEDSLSENDEPNDGDTDEEPALPASPVEKGAPAEAAMPAVETAASEVDQAPDSSEEESASSEKNTVGSSILREENIVQTASLPERAADETSVPLRNTVDTTQEMPEANTVSGSSMDTVSGIQGTDSEPLEKPQEHVEIEYSKRNMPSDNTAETLKEHTTDAQQPEDDTSIDTCISDVADTQSKILQTEHTPSVQQEHTIEPVDIDEDLSLLEEVEEDTQPLPLSTPLSEVMDIQNAETARPVFDPSDPNNLFTSLEEITAPVERIKQTGSSEAKPEMSASDIQIPDATETTFTSPNMQIQDTQIPEQDTNTSAEDETAASQMDIIPGNQTIAVGSHTEAALPEEEAVIPSVKDEFAMAGNLAAIALEDETALMQPVENTSTTAESPVAHTSLEEEATHRGNTSVTAIPQDEPEMPLVFVNGVPLPNGRSDILDTMVVIDSEKLEAADVDAESVHSASASSMQGNAAAGIKTADTQDAATADIETTDTQNDVDTDIGVEAQEVDSTIDMAEEDTAGGGFDIQDEEDIETSETETDIGAEAAAVPDENTVEADIAIDGFDAQDEYDAESGEAAMETDGELEPDIDGDDSEPEADTDDSAADAGTDADESFLKTIEQTVPIIPAKPVSPPPPRKKYAIPFDLLTNYPDGEYWIVDDATRRSALMLKSTFNEFKIDVSITGIRKGPVVTMFEMLPSPGIKLSKITNLQDNIALRLAASSVRIVAPIPGKHAVGIEVPNKKRSIVSFRELIETDLPEAAKMAIPVVLGKDVTGNPQLLDLAQTPHLLIAGATGSGKSVCVNTIILSILYNRRPDEVKLILVDPKIVELKLYNDIAHLLTPVITEPKRAFQALQYALCEMERRYALLDNMGVRDIKTFNAKIKSERIATEALPYIVIIIDEFADLMATSGKELEATVARLCAMSRAVGIHLVLATQRPSIDVITGLIKANIPSRIAFMVASKTDSRIILDEMGAEKLLGKGDMLYVSAARPFPTRMQGAFVSEQEVERVVACVKEYCEPEYIDDEIFVDDDDEPYENAVFSDDNDPLYDQALEIVTFAGKASASYVQRKLKIGYNRAARLIEEMEARGIVGPANGSKPREVIRHV